MQAAMMAKMKQQQARFRDAAPKAKAEAEDGDKVGAEVHAPAFIYKAPLLKALCIICNIGIQQ